jgi:zinc transporter ZupT
MLRAAQAQDRERARRRWKRLRAAVVLMQVVRYLQERAKATRRLSTAFYPRGTPRSAGSSPREERPRRSSRSSGASSKERPRRRSRDSPERMLSKSWTLGDSSNSFFDSSDAFYNMFKSAVSTAGAKDADRYSAVELEDMQQHKVGALKMYAVLLVDGIPEGILMGFLAAEGFLSTTLVLSFLIANFPEAFAGGVLMQKGGFSRWQIVALWGGLMLMIGVLAGVSCHLLLMVDPEFTGETHVPFEIQILVSVMEGLAGGAMISGIAGTMLPEAYERRNKTGWMITSGGFLCTIGFLTSVGIKIAFD